MKRNLIPLVLSLALVTAHPQLDLPRNQPDRTFFNFPARTKSSSNPVQAELTSVSVVSDNVSNTGGDLLNLLNRRTSSLPANTRSRTVSTASSSSGSGSDSDSDRSSDSERGPRQRYSCAGTAACWLQLVRRKERERKPVTI